MRSFALLLGLAVLATPVGAAEPAACPDGIASNTCIETAAAPEVVHNAPMPAAYRLRSGSGLVMTGGGPGADSTPFQFSLDNVNTQ